MICKLRNAATEMAWNFMGGERTQIKLSNHEFHCRLCFASQLANRMIDFMLLKPEVSVNTIITFSSRALVLQMRERKRRLQFAAAF